jgi:hypothetical protein
MEELLGKFQTDLGQVSDEIRQLQVQSQTMSTKLKNRRAAENKLGAFVEQMAVPEDLINSVLDAEVGGGNGLGVVPWMVYTGVYHGCRLVCSSVCGEARATGGSAAVGGGFACPPVCCACYSATPCCATLACAGLLACMLCCQAGMWLPCHDLLREVLHNTDYTLCCTISTCV